MFERKFPSSKIKLSGFSWIYNLTPKYNPMPQLKKPAFKIVLISNL